ncbi:PD-(D/E)XK motif protein [Streptomyces sp. NPDC059786]|uniref:PD-(D/E)XK motif protein n=1 Tax=Streptomyces sp. NPDC059786 TaxID=3346946 RepID=UPI00366268EE
MRDEALRDIVEARWTALGAEQATDERRLRVAQLSVTVAYGPMAVAVDHEGHRHLLIPIHGSSKVRSGIDGPVLRLRKRPLEDEETYQTYADLSCLRQDLDDLFTELCLDVLQAAAGMPRTPVKALHRVLDRWKALFRTEGAPLGPEQLAGLFGELTVLIGLLERDPGAHRLWRGPDGHRHDFTSGVTALEVKAGITDGARRPRIHGLDQLDPPEGGMLGLVWLRLQRSSGNSPGTAFVDLVERALHLCDDEGAVLDLLAAAGYRLADAERYHDVRFSVIEERWYRVGPDFPSLTGRALAAAGVPVTALDVEYSIDLSGDSPVPLPSDQVSRLIDSLIQESA